MGTIKILCLSFVICLIYEAIDFKARNKELNDIRAQSYQNGINHGLLISQTALNCTLDMTKRDKANYLNTIEKIRK